MAYQTPPQWVHGNVPTAADMNKYSDAQNAIHAITGDVLRAYPAAHVLAGNDHDLHYFVHRFRWLFFQSTGSIEDPANADNSISLSEDGEPTVYDLNQIDWMFPGKLYYVNGCTWAVESRSP